MTKEKLTVCLVAGTRPEVIKLAPVFFALRSSASFAPYWLSTGQHRHMMDQALASFEICADSDLMLMQPDQTLSELTARALNAVGQVLDQIRPAAVLVQGDTSTVLGSAIAAFYRRIPLGHVEAGLRTFDMNSPWPEEMHRRVIAPMCQWHFAPTPLAKQHLLAESIPLERCHMTGNTVIDALHYIQAKASNSTIVKADRARRLGFGEGFVTHFLGEFRRDWILLTLHRRESFGKVMGDICNALRNVLERNPEMGLVCPMHLNPSVRKTIVDILGNHPRVTLIEPADYSDFVWLMDASHFIVSDSGGVQEEAPSLGKPVLVVRDTTERPEGIEAGTCKLIGTAPEKIVHEAEILIRDPVEYKARSTLSNPYGDGLSAQRIVQVLTQHFAE